VERGMQESASKLSSRLAAALSSKDKVVPILSTSERWIIVPEDFKQDDNYIGHYMITVSKLLGLTVYSIPYEGERIPNLPMESEKISIGILTSLQDTDRKIRVTQSKKDSVELGRTIVRAQQVMKLFTSKNLGLEALKQDHRFFGNNPSEVKVIANFPTKVVYTAKELGLLFEHKAWAEQLRKLLITLMRESAIFLKADAADHAIETNLLTREEAIVKFCSRSQATVVKRGRKAKTEKVSRVPKKPRASPLLTKREMDFINHVSRGIFIEPSEEELKDWPLYIIRKGFANVKSQLESNYSLRRRFLAGFARITTSRLTEFRKLKPNERYKKKKDIALTDVDALLDSRDNKPKRLAREVSFVDPQFTEILSVYRKLSTSDSATLDVVGSLMNLEEDIIYGNVYTDKIDEPVVPAKEPEVHKKDWEDIKLDVSSQGKKLPTWEDIGPKVIKITEPETFDNVSDQGSYHDSEADYDPTAEEAEGRALDSFSDEIERINHTPLDEIISIMMSKLTASKGMLNTTGNLNIIQSWLDGCVGDNKDFRRCLLPRKKFNGEEDPEHWEWAWRGYLALSKFKLTESRKALSSFRDALIENGSQGLLDPEFKFI